MIVKNIRNIFPLPKSWEKDDDLRKFGIRINDAIRELFSRRVAKIKAGSTVLSSDENDIVLLGSAATQAVANNLTTTTSGKVLDARQGKALNDGKIDKMPSYTTVASGETANTALSNSSMYLIVIEGATSEVRTVIIATVGSAGTVYSTQILPTSNLTISYTTNRIKVVNNSSAQVRVHLINLGTMEE